MFESLVKNLNQDLAILQQLISLEKGIGFNNMSRLIEAISIKFFEAVGIADLRNMNQIRVNFPAIDLADDLRKIAVQVTSTADSSKIRKTIALFEKNNSQGRSLHDEYDHLYIFGFCKAAKIKTIPNYCIVVDTSFFVNRIIDEQDETQLQLMVDTIRKHIDYTSIHPHQDVDCLNIVLGYINRSAIKHEMDCEGNVDHMLTGLDEVSELIGKGTVNGKDKSKAMNNFQDANIKGFLANVLDQIGKIKAIANRKSHGGSYYFDQQDMESVNRAKQDIIESAQKICSRYQIDMPLNMQSGA